MRTIRWLLMGLLVIVAPGCAQKTDWVEGTLVTVDVTGVWRGRMTTGSQGEMEMTLTQRGAKVTGEGRLRSQKISIEGTVRGDLFSFTDTGGRLRAQATVSGDEMSGAGRTNLGNVGPGQQFPFDFTLAR